MRRLKISIVLWLSSMLTAAAMEIHVAPDGNDSGDGTPQSPLKSLSAVQQAVRKVAGKEAVTIFLHGGVYPLVKPLDLGIEDSGTPDKPVVWKAWKGETAVISGGIRVTGWSPYGNGIWKATLKRKTKLRQLYVNDRPGDMAAYEKALIPIAWRMPFDVTGKEDWAAEPGDAFQAMAFKADTVPDVKHPEDLEMQQRRTWTIQRSEVMAIRQTKPDEKIIVIPKALAAIGFRMGWGCGWNIKKWKEVYLYNALEFIDRPGEFYFDRAARTLYYKPRPGQDMRTAEVIAPITDQLVKIEGTDLKHHAHDISFEGITFAHTGWQMMKLGGHYGALTTQSSAMNIKFLADGMVHSNPASPIYTSMDTPPGVVEMRWGERFNISDCVFRDLGSTALNIENDVRNVKVVGNVFQWVDGGGINVGHPQHTYIGKQNGDNNGFGPYNIDNSHDKWDEDHEGLVTDVLIENNLFRQVCRTWWQMSPLAVYYGHSIHMLHNDIKDTPYNAVTIGWGWGEFDGIANPKKYHATLGKKGGRPSLSVNDIKLNYNKIANAYRRLRDTGAIYFIGDQAMQVKGETPKYSEVVGNYLIEPAVIRQKLIYTDEGTAYLDINGNVLDGKLGDWCIFYRRASSRNKTFENNFARSDPDLEKRIKNKKKRDPNMIDRNNTYLPRKEKEPPASLGTWPPEAQAIIKNSGLQPEYRNLFKKLLPE